MKNKLLTLKRTANKAAKLRGHNMAGFTSSGLKENQRAYSYCHLCAMTMMIRERPLPNEIDIAGEAVTINCKGKIK